MTAVLFTPEALSELFEAIEEVLATSTYPEHLNGSDPACTVHPDALIALEDAYDQLLDQCSEAEAAP